MTIIKLKYTKHSIFVALIAILFATSCGIHQTNKRGYRNLKNGKYEKAKKLYFKVLEKKPKDKDAHRGLGRVELLYKNYPGAFFYLTSAIKYGSVEAKKDRALYYYTLAKIASNKNDFPNAIYNLENSLVDFPNFKPSLKYMPRFYLRKLKFHLKKENYPEAFKSYLELKNNKKPYYSSINEELNSVEPLVIIGMSSYSLSNKDIEKSHFYANLAVNGKGFYFEKYKNNALENRSRISEYESDLSVKFKNYSNALIYINKAINDYYNKSYIHKRAFIYCKIAELNLNDGNLTSAFRNINTALSEGSKRTIQKSLRVRSKIYFQLAKESSSLEDKIRLTKKSLKDYYHDSEVRNFMVDLYLQKAMKKVDNENFEQARKIIYEVVQIDNDYNGMYELLTSSIEYASWEEAKYYKLLAKAEIYAANLKIHKAISLAKEVRENSRNLVPDGTFALSKYYAINGNNNTAIDLLNEFFLRKDLFNYYNHYREIAHQTKEFIPLSGNDRFKRWLNGEHRVMLTLNQIYNIPQKDRGGIKPPSRYNSDVFVKVTHLNQILLTTNIVQDVTHIDWPENYFRTIFDYDVDYPINFMVIDSDFFDDQIIEYDSFKNFYPELLREIIFRNGSIMEASILDASSHLREESSYVKLPPKFGVFTILENDYIRQDQKAIPVYYGVTPFNASPSGLVLTVKSLGSKLLPCFATLIVSANIQNFLARQAAYIIIKQVSNQDITNRDIIVEPTIEKVVKSSGDKSLDNANTLRVLCDCVFRAIQDEWNE